MEKRWVFLVACLVGASFTPASPFTATAEAWDGPICSYDGTLSVPVSIFTEAAQDASATAWCSPTVVEPEAAPITPTSAYFPPALAEPILADDAAASLARARTLAEGENYAGALLELNVVEAAYPIIADRISLLRGDYLLAQGENERALESYMLARESLDGAIRAYGRVGRVRSLIRSGSRDAAEELAGLMRFYPSLPQAPELRYEFARSVEESDLSRAVRIYREIDIAQPGTQVARLCHERLDALRDQGLPVREFTSEQRVARLENLSRRGPHSMARQEAERMLSLSLSSTHMSRVRLVAARVARIEGRWEDAQRYLRQGVAAGTNGDETRERELERIHDAATAAANREAATARARISQLRGGRLYRALNHQRLARIVGIAVRAGLTDEANEALAVLASSGSLHPAVAWEAGLLGAGGGDDAHVLVLFEKVMNTPGNRGTAGRYHYARTLERMQRYREAEAQFLRVVYQDQSETGWYAMLSQQRLWVVREGLVCDCDPEQASARLAAQERTEPLVLAALDVMVDPSRRAASRQEGRREPEPNAVVPRPEIDLVPVFEKLRPLAERHPVGYPWFARAEALLELGEIDAATDELHEAYLAHRAAHGRTLRRAGLEAVYRGEEAPVQAVGPEMRRAQRSISAADKAILVEVVSMLGDEGTAVGLEGWSRAQTRPRAYEYLVEQAARRHGLDPNLMLAVMRTESVYQRRIVSYAGAIGLMQIMPRTGRHIASALGKDDFTVADLTDAETNLDFAAWYLASLIERFDGRLPLAIASYNGGPHNVRRWIREHGEQMPLDAFVERIPFEQTHRYVRRVLGHYAIYREQAGLQMERLGTTLPQPDADPVAF